MKLLILLLLALTVVFALPTNGVEKRAEREGCISSTLTWSARQVDTVSKGITRLDAFALDINQVYYGIIAPHTSQNDVFIESKDKTWSVKHGEVAQNKTLTLIYKDQTFAFEAYQNKKRIAQLSKITEWEYEYYCCI
ncbi:hypothetical protein KI688_002509 [Linnemannia hyalina]|uniref:Uncharacterized protein n=1 Tax=Linnemannia hyalina TaxID=64524 RepID=A0A9P8BRN5_9FUNG|nr:hypothetical protein KI688_002509 [Linnemannia hyalina]